MARLILLEKRRKNSYQTVFFFPCRRGLVGFGRTPSWHTWRAFTLHRVIFCSSDDKISRFIKSASNGRPGDPLPP